MDRTIRNLDEDAYRQMKARAALSGKTLGECISEAIHAYLARDLPAARRSSLLDIVGEKYPAGSERTSEEIDSLLYAGRS